MFKRNLVEVAGAWITVPGLTVQLSPRPALYVGIIDVDGEDMAEVRYLNGHRADAFTSIVPFNAVRPL